MNFAHADRKCSRFWASETSAGRYHSRQPLPGRGMHAYQTPGAMPEVHNSLLPGPRNGAPRLYLLASVGGLWGGNGGSKRIMHVEWDNQWTQYLAACWWP